jgi:hypothetical protein
MQNRLEDKSPIFLSIVLSLEVFAFLTSEILYYFAETVVVFIDNLKRSKKENNSDIFIIVLNVIII